MQQQLYFVGTEAEIAHHAAPLAGKVDFQVVIPELVLQRAQPGDLAVFYSEHFDRFRHAITELKKANVATLYLIDGILEWRNAWENSVDEPACPFTMRPILSHKAACIGHSQARILSHWGNGDKVEVIGVPRFDRLSDLRKKTNKNENRILIMTAKCPSFTEEQRNKVIQSLNDLNQYFSRHPEIEPIWRLTGELDREIGIKNQISDLTGIELAEVLQKVDAVITTPSTAALEAMLIGLPTAFIDYTNSPPYVQSAWSITTKNHIPSIVGELLDPPERKLLYQSHQLRFEVMADGNATTRLQDLISEMSQASKIAIEQQQPLRFPKNLLPVPPTQDVEFRHSELFAGFPEFQSENLIEIQAELAHARREITYLQSQLSQVRSELGQAHLIFDEINNHPIAGPIVKLRAKIIELLAKLKSSKSQPSTEQS